MPEPHPSLRIFVLGAGFSKPAGLPLAAELFAEVRNLIEQRHGRDTWFQHDLDNYIRYRAACDENDAVDTDFSYCKSVIDDVETFLIAVEKNLRLA